jgi:hypothetical protein
VRGGRGYGVSKRYKEAFEGKKMGGQGERERERCGYIHI